VHAQESGTFPGPVCHVLVPDRDIDLGAEIGSRKA
jgi:hypothetical protein